MRMSTLAHTCCLRVVSFPPHSTPLKDVRRRRLGGGPRPIHLGQKNTRATTHPPGRGSLQHPRRRKKYGSLPATFAPESFRGKAVEYLAAVGIVADGPRLHRFARHGLMAWEGIGFAFSTEKKIFMAVYLVYSQ